MTAITLNQAMVVKQRAVKLCIDEHGVLDLKRFDAIGGIPRERALATTAAIKSLGHQQRAFGQAVPGQGRFGGDRCPGSHPSHPVPCPQRARARQSKDQSHHPGRRARGGGQDRSQSQVGHQVSGFGEHAPKLGSCCF